MWEDDGNRNGGKISIKLKKDYTTLIWEEIILSIIGDVLPAKIKEEINGAVISVRRDFNILQIWFKNYHQNIISEIEQTLKELLQIPDGVELETKRFFKGLNNSSKESQSNRIQSKRKY